MLIEMSGRKVGRLLVISRAENNRRGQARWFCLCECGAESIVNGYALRSGNTKSCGCWRNDLTVERSTIHGHGRRKKQTKAYKYWKYCRHWKKTDLDFPEFLESHDPTPKERQAN